LADQLPPPRDPSNDDDSADNFGAFDDFVNKHLDFDPSATAPSEKPKFSTRSFFEADNDDLDEALDDDDDDDDDFGDFDSLKRGLSASKNPFVSGRGLPSSPPPPPISGFGGTLGKLPPPPIGASSSGSSSFAPPRIPFPVPSDSRWVEGIVRTKGDLEIYQTFPIFAPARTIVVPPSVHHANPSIRYIRDIAPGWTAVQYKSSRQITGWVKNSDATFYAFRFRLMPLHEMRWFQTLYKFRITLNGLDIAFYLLIAGLLLLVFSAFDGSVFYDARPDMQALQTQVFQQSLEIERLNGLLEPTPAPTLRDTAPDR
jgi:hypothetical protein